MRREPKLKRLLLIALSLTIVGCSSLPMVDAPSANQNGRVNFLILHFTSETFAESLRLLTQRTDRPVSSHYLVPEGGDETYPSDAIKVYRLVDEGRRAWHAGVSHWGDHHTLNDQSIGIEIVNQSRCVNHGPDGSVSKPEEQTCNYLAYGEEQIDLLISLVTGILERHPDIDPVDVIGHADIAPARRVDPGPEFPWQILHEHGIGAWYNSDAVTRYWHQFSAGLPDIADIQAALGTYGYRIDVTGVYDVQTQFAVRAFQMHFRPSGYTGTIDAETVAILYALIDKYRAPDAD